MSDSFASISLPSSDRLENLTSALDDVRKRVSAAAKNPSLNSQNPRLPVLVAVSKYKPASDVLACFEHGQRDFGENYVAELVEKAAKLPVEVRWHFIGTLQSNKCKVLAGIPNLFAIQTLDSPKKATILDKALPSARADPLHVFIQVNTSGEASKSGIQPLDATSGSTSTNEPLILLARHIVQTCPRLHLRGLMTIGSVEQSTSAEGNLDFARLVDTASRLEAVLASDGESRWGVGENGEAHKLELSMGMSADFEQAISAGAGTVRVGTGIFGARQIKQEVSKKEVEGGQGNQGV